jgi:hypothetical protein
MTDGDFTTQRGVTLRRIDSDVPYNYEVVSRESGETVGRVGWLSLQPSGAPLAFGDAPAEVQIGGDKKKRVSFTRSDTTDGVIEAAGAQIYLGDDA